MRLLRSLRAFSFIIAERDLGVALPLDVNSENGELGVLDQRCLQRVVQTLSHIDHAPCSVSRMWASLGLVLKSGRFIYCVSPMEGGTRSGTWVMTIISDSPKNEPRMGVLSILVFSVEWCFLSAATLWKFHLRYHCQLASDVPSDVVTLLSF